MEKLLVIEDDDLSQEVIRMLFKSNFEIDFCESVDEYYEKYSDSDYALIIMDISLRGTKNGLELTKEIKAEQSYPQTPILCLTAHAQSVVRRMASESGSDLVLTKPVNNNILREAVNTLLKSKHSGLKMRKNYLGTNSLL